MIHHTHRLIHFQRLLRGGSIALVASLMLPALAQAAITTTGSVTGGGTPYNGTDNPWATSALTIGDLGAGTLSIDSGSDVNNTGLARIARVTNTGTVTVSGAGSTWTNTGTLSVAEGSGSTGTLNITGGGSVSNVQAVIAGAPASIGNVTVSGAGSAWTSTGDLIMGSVVVPPGGSGSPTLAITGGGSVSNVNGSINGSLSSGTTLTVSGAGSIWTNTGNMSLGSAAGDRKATMEITGGASVSNVNGVIYSSTTNILRTTATVSGVGSTWTNSGSLTMALTGFATLNINSGGLVVAAALNEGTANNSLAFDGGTLRITATDSATNLITLGAGGGTLDIPTAANTFSILPGFGGGAGIISGAGGLTKTAAGTLALAQANTYGGGTTINGGKLLANNTTGSATGTGNVTVNTGGTLGGTGTVSGAVSVGGGTLAPGASIGTLNTGNIFLTDTASKLSLELNLGATPAADLLNVTGGITFTNSTLDLSVADVPLSLPTMTFLVAANDASDPILGTFATINGVPAGYVATVNYAFTGTDTLGRIGDGNDLAVTLQVPEPGTIVLLSEMVVIGVGFVALRKRFGWA